MHASSVGGPESKGKYEYNRYSFISDEFVDGDDLIRRMWINSLWVRNGGEIDRCHVLDYRF